MENLSHNGKLVFQEGLLRSLLSVYKKSTEIKKIHVNWRFRLLTDL